MKRRAFITKTAIASASVITPLGACKTEEKKEEKSLHLLKGNINHSVCRWTYGDTPLPQFLKQIKSIGIHAIDLIGPSEWPILKEHDVYCSMCNGAEINLVDGWNNPKFHDQLIERYSKQIPLVNEAGYQNLILFSGNRNGMDDTVGIQNAAKGIKEIISLAEKNEVILHLEIFNSKVDHPDYMADSTRWGVALIDAVGSDHLKLLYDIYHMQVQEGNIIQTIRDFHPYIGHYHTAGVPGRNEIDLKQELYYPAVMEAIKETSFKGYVAQEFIPKAELPFESLKEAIQICDV